MKPLLQTLYILLFIILSSFECFSQKDDKAGINESFFNFDALNFYSPDNTGSRVDVYIEVPFDKIEFKKNKAGGDNYSSDIDFTITVLKKNGEVTFNKVYREVIKTQKTDLEFLSRNSQIITKNIFLEPGDYTVKIASREISSKKLFEREKPVKVRDFRYSPVTLSDVMIVSKLVESQGKKYITPLASRNAGSLDTVYLFFFVYLNRDASSLKVNCRLLNSKDEEVFSSNQSGDAASGLEFDNQYIFAVPTAKLANDNYKIELTAVTPDNSASSVSGIEYRWLNFPASLDDIDLAVDQLQYIATDDEMNKLRKAKTPADKLKRLMEFWKSKDPSPSTSRNEVMIEYYNRIDYANKNYSTKYTQGWRTDMGMVYIIFGLPNNVERHPYEMDTKPYEIWDYYEINRQFIFVDESGFGDYRLITPIWDTFRYKN